MRRLKKAERDEVLNAYERYLSSIPERKRTERIMYDVKDVVGRTGFGIGSAGLPAYNFLIEGYSQALENDVVLSMKQGNVAAPSRVVDDEHIRGYFEHHGLTEPAEIGPVLGYLGQATAKIHCVSDEDSEQSLVDFQTEEAIAEAIGDTAKETRAFADEMAAFGLAYARRARADYELFVDAFREGAIAEVPPA